MNITICGSMKFHEKMRRIQKKLENLGHRVLVPKSIELMDKFGYVNPTIDEAKVQAKIQHDFIREHFKKIEKADAILVLNYDKKGIRHYIGGNTFLEIGIAFWLGKKVFLINPVPKMDYAVEMHSMKPIVIDGDLGKIG
jgi:nucleoside 2-deoxyribosyltransferase